MYKKRKPSSKKKHASMKHKTRTRNKEEECLSTLEFVPGPTTSRKESIISKQHSSEETHLHKPPLSKLSVQSDKSCSLQKYFSDLSLQPSVNLFKECGKKTNFVREFFLHYLCQVCKQIPVTPILCKKCQMITYCSDEHRRKHWPNHMEICEAIEKICKERNTSHLLQYGVGLSSEEFKNYRFQNMSLCQQIVTRKLELWEREIFLHPNVCEICYEYDNKKLYNCGKCHHISFCGSHKNDKHDNWCYALIQYREFVQYYSTFGVVDVSLSITKCLQKYPSFLSGFGEVLPEAQNSVHYLELTEIASGPLTTFHALQICFSEELKSLISLEVHLIGAESNFETNYLEKWEFHLMHLIPNLKTLKIVFVGPELNITYEKGKEKHVNCDECKEKKKYLEFQYFSGLYHEYAKCKTYKPPGIICVFNPGLYRSTGYSGSDTWPMTIEAMFLVKKIPVVLTAYTKTESQLDLQRIETIQQINAIKGPCKNPFSSLKPTLNFFAEHETPVIFKNFYYMLIKMD